MSDLFANTTPPTERRYFAVLDRHGGPITGELASSQPIQGFGTVTDAHTWARQHLATSYRIAQLPGCAGYVAALVRENDEDTARSWYGDDAVDEYFDEVEGIARAAA